MLMALFYQTFIVFCKHQILCCESTALDTFSSPLCFLTQRNTFPQHHPGKSCRYQGASVRFDHNVIPSEKAYYQHSSPSLAQTKTTLLPKMAAAPTYC